MKTLIKAAVIFAVLFFAIEIVSAKSHISPISLTPKAIPYSFKIKSFRLPSITTENFYTYDTVKTVTVQSGKIVFKLTTAAIKKIAISVPLYRNWMLNYKGTLIKNNDVADNIIAILKIGKY